MFWHIFYKCFAFFGRDTYQYEELCCFVNCKVNALKFTQEQVDILMGVLQCFKGVLIDSLTCSKILKFHVGGVYSRFIDAWVFVV